MRRRLIFGLWLRLLRLRDLRRQALALGDVWHGRHLGYLPALGIGNQNPQTIQGKADGAIQFHPGLLISGHRRYQIRLRLCQVTLVLQHQRSGGRSKGILFLLGVQRLPAQFDRGSRRFHAGPVLLHGELGVAHFDAHLVLELLQAHLRLPVFQFGAHLVGLRCAVPERNGQAQSDTFIRSTRVEELPNGSSNAGAGRNIGGLGAEGLRRSRANSRVRIERAAQPGAAIIGKHPE